MSVTQQCAVIYRELRRLDAEVFGQSARADGGTSEPVAADPPKKRHAPRVPKVRAEGPSIETSVTVSAPGDRLC
jgi:hypothetical protein